MSIEGEKFRKVRNGLAAAAFVVFWIGTYLDGSGGSLGGSFLIGLAGAGTVFLYAALFFRRSP